MQRDSAGNAAWLTGTRTRIISAMPDPLPELRRYADLIDRLIRRTDTPTAASNGPVRAFTPAPDAESATAVQVERGVVFAHALDRTPNVVAPGQTYPSVERLIELSRSPRLPSIAVVDRSGHHRPAYRALLVYAWLQAFGLAYETLPRSEFGRWEEALRAWCDVLESDLGTIEWPGDAIPAGRGPSATEGALNALALHVAGKVFVRDAWTDLAAHAFGRLQKRQLPSGAFLLAGRSDNPETHWYHELLILHAAASYAVQAEDRSIAGAVSRATAYHLQETQPDHATAQPWALFAFIWNQATRPLADQILHSATAQSGTSGDPTPGDRFDGISLMLLTDALYCLRLFAPEGSSKP